MEARRPHPWVRLGIMCEGHDADDALRTHGRIAACDDSELYVLAKTAAVTEVRALGWPARSGRYALAAAEGMRAITGHA